MDDSQLCGRIGLSRGKSDRWCGRLGEPRRPCERNHRVGLPCLLNPFGGPCASVAETGALTLSGSAALASFASADARSSSGAACACSPEGEFRDVKVAPNGPFATWKHSDQQWSKVGNPSLRRRVERDLARPTTAPICRMTLVLNRTRVSAKLLALARCSARVRLSR